MKKYAIPFLLIFLLLGCQNQNSSEEIYNQANYIYLAIKDKVENDSPLPDEIYDEMETFKKQYIYKYKEYPSDKELIGEMDILINSYTSFNVSKGLNETDEVKMYQTRLNDSIKKLDKQFNK